MFLHPTGHPSNLYLSQILVTGTSILITSDLLTKHHEVFVDFVAVLTDVIDSRTSNLSNLLMRKAACECLWELELAYPGLFQSKLDHLYDKCAAENSSIFQSYLVLFVTVLRHAIENLARNSENGLEANCINALLTSRTEPLKPLYISSQLSENTFPVHLHSPPCGLPAMTIPLSVDMRELKRAISFLIENAHLLNTNGLCFAMTELMQCVKLANLSPITFKSQFIHWVSTSDLKVFHMLLLMKLKFSNDMFQQNDELLLLQRLLVRSSQPTLTTGQRLLSYEWLMHFPEECKTGHAPVEPQTSLFLEDSQFGYFYPLPFDSVEIIQTKLKLLSLCIWPSEVQDKATFILMNCLALLKKHVMLGLNGKAVRALFRVVFLYYQHHADTALAQEIYRLVLLVVTKHPKFMPFVVDFLDSVAIETPDSRFPIDLLQALSQHIISQPISVILPNLGHHLKLLGQAMRETYISPLSTIQFLRQILQSSEIAEIGDWIEGNCVLAVCHSILQHHDTGEVVGDLGNLLLQIATTFQDIDIRDRARFYYSLLTNVSSEKASKILQSDMYSKQSLPHVMAEDITSTSFPVAPPVQHVQVPFLKLTRVEAKQNIQVCEDEVEISSLDLKPYGLLGAYTNMVEGKSWKPEIPIQFYVHYDASSRTESTPNEIFALVLRLRTNRKYKSIKDILIPCLSASTSSCPSGECYQITVKFHPEEPVPAVYNVRATFNDESGLTHTMTLQKLKIKFSDLFLPLTLPTGFQEGDVAKTKRKLFLDLWESVLLRQRKVGAMSNNGAESVVCLSVDWQSGQRIVQENLQNYIIDIQDEEIKIGIFLPPRQHLLMKFTIRNQKATAAIATDDWRILGLVESYLRELENL
ncbi:AP-5 complex subunit beta-1 isoform X2 [Nematostella vectensis]|nr:AP-5 complex subunit beta-1 isoform X2 [Nematostella vectensis]